MVRADNPARVSIIIVSFNTADLLADCLQSVYDDPDSEHWQIIVADNASGDDSVAMVLERFPGVHVLALDRNYGFAAANNRGAEVACGDHLLFLNSDTVVPVGAIGELADYLEATPDAAIVGARLLSPDGSLQLSARSFPGPLNTFLLYSGLSRLLPGVRPFGAPYLSYIDHTQVNDVDYVDGACLMMRRATFDRLGGWCEDYFLYAEDADLCFRARQLGASVIYYGPRHITHVGGASAARVAVRSTLESHRSTFLFILRHRGRAAFWLTRLLTTLGVLPRLLATAIAYPFAALLGRADAMGSRVRLYRRVLALCLSRNVLPTGGLMR